MLSLDEAVLEMKGCLAEHLASDSLKNRHVHGTQS